MEQKQVAAEKQVLSKLEKIKLDQEARAAALAKDAQAEELQVRGNSPGCTAWQLMSRQVACISIARPTSRFVVF